MFTKAFAFLLLLPALASAQYGAPPGPASPTTTSAAPAAPSAPPSTSTQINVDVAPGQTYSFNPSNFTAQPGTLVTFYFPTSSLNHSVTQSSFSNPCTYLAANASTNTSAGFNSGLLTQSTFTINITDTSPIWFFCVHPLHCGMGMVGSINAPTTGNTYDAFLAAAMAIGASEATESDPGLVTGGVHATAIGPPASDVSAAPAPSSAIKVTTSIGFVLFAAILGVAMA